MNRRASLAVMAGLGGGTLALGTRLARAAGDGAGGLTAPITGVVKDAAGNITGQVAGTINLSHFGVNSLGNHLLGKGTVTAAVTDPVTGDLLNTIQKVVQLLVHLNESSGTCTILTLTLGPLDLNLLGLMVHLNRVVLVITANPAGGLLGSLLCDIANLLNNGGLLADLATLLNQLLGLFG